MITSTIKSIEQLKSYDGVNLSRLQALFDQLSSSGIHITNPAHLGKEYFTKSIKSPFLDTLSANLEERFVDKSVKAAFDILIFQKSQQICSVWK